MGGADLWEGALHWCARGHNLPRTHRVPPGRRETGKAPRVLSSNVSWWDSCESSARLLDLLLHSDLHALLCEVYIMWCVKLIAD